MPEITRTVRSGDQAIDGLLEAHRWSVSALTFSFPTASSQYDGYRAGSEPYVNFEPLNVGQREAVRSILDSISSVADISFSEVAGGAGDLRFGMSDFTEAAHAYTPDTRPWGGDSWYNNASRWFDDPVLGSYGYHAFNHEIGHALGLKHPHENYNFGRVPPEHDQMAYSVMSYRSFRDASVDGGYANEEFGFAQSLMMDDIAALQHLYGASFDDVPVDTVYSWSPQTGQMFVNGAGEGVPRANRVFRTVWDGGGTDTYDFSRYDTNIVVDLRPGQWSNTGQRPYLGGPVPGTIANALLYKGDSRSLIENATAGAGDDRMFGNDAANRLEGGSGEDELDGGAGIDLLIGGADGDDYFVNDLLDTIVERATTEGDDDAVWSSVSYTLGRNVERLWLTGTGALEGTGNELSNSITGNRDNNVIDGREGADFMNGNGGDDLFYVDNIGDEVRSGSIDDIETIRSTITYSLLYRTDRLELIGSSPIDGTGTRFANVLTGNVADNVLDGGAGADILEGGLGNDTYAIDDVGDQVIERGGEGDDSVRSSIDHVLGTQLEHLALVGRAAIDGTGNGRANSLTGNGAANRLDGGAGADTMAGAGGNDIYVVDSVSDRIVEVRDGGIDAVVSSADCSLAAWVETLTLVGADSIHGIGNSAANVITGGLGDNLLAGRGGDDSLFGRGGIDRLVGGTGADDFCFDTRPHARLNVDEVVDFVRLEDDIHLDRSVFSGIAENGRLAADAFRRGTEAQDASDRILFDAASGSLFYDADGSGEAAAAILFARVGEGVSVASGDFIVYG